MRDQNKQEKEKKRKEEKEKKQKETWSEQILCRKKTKFQETIINNLRGDRMY